MSRHDPELHLPDPMAGSLLDRLIDAPLGSPINRALQARPSTWLGLEQGYQRLLTPAQPGPFSVPERQVVAAFVAVLIDEPQSRQHFHTLLAQTDGALAQIIRQEAEGAALPGPYGRFPAGPLSAEDMDGPIYSSTPSVAETIGPRLSAALDYAHLLTLHPRDITASSSASLSAAGWASAEIIELTQLISFLGYLIRVVAGLRAYLSQRQPQLATQD